MSLLSKFSKETVFFFVRFSVFILVGKGKSFAMTHFVFRSKLHICSFMHVVPLKRRVWTDVGTVELPTIYSRCKFTLMNNNKV